jgi:hypothetical protein
VGSAALVGVHGGGGARAFFIGWRPSASECGGPRFCLLIYFFQKTQKAILMLSFASSSFIALM